MEELRRENDQLKDQLADKFIRDVNDDTLNREISAIKDPSAFAAVKSIMIKMNKQKDEIKSLKQEISQAGNLQRSIGESSNKIKQKDTEIKTLQLEIKKLMSQNEFLLREFEFVHKKQNQGKPAGPLVHQPTEVVNNTDNNHSELVREVTFDKE